jgi:bacteriocin-like protein
MSDQEKKQQSTNITPEPDAENKKQSTELSEEELKKVSGGFLQIGMQNVLVSSQATTTKEN